MIHRADPVPAAQLLSIYRSANEAILRPVVEAAVDAGWDVDLWALDEAAPVLRPFTRGTGPGLKFELIERLLSAQPIEKTCWTVVVDDDVVVRRGSLDLFLRIADRCGFALAQPAHGPNSYWSHRVTVERPLAIARWTRFVEIGPVFAVHPRWLRAALSPAGEYGMGWGLDIHWASLPDARLGVVDLVQIEHVAPVAATYSTSEGLGRAQAELTRSSLASYDSLQATVGVWRPWQRRPPWVVT